MANPFKEAEKKKKVAPGTGSNKETKEAEEKEVTPAVPEEIITPVVPEVKEDVVEEVIQISDKVEALLGPVEKPKKKERSAVSVYLAKENQAWLKKTASQRGKSVSELLDQILTELRG